jgi:cell division protein FtsL
MAETASGLEVVRLTRIVRELTAEVQREKEARCELESQFARLRIKKQEALARVADLERLVQSVFSMVRGSVGPVLNAFEEYESRWGIKVAPARMDKCCEEDCDRCGGMCCKHSSDQ